MLAEYGKKRLQRQSSSQDPRLVDMEDSISEKPQENDVDTGTSLNELQFPHKTENVQGISHQSENSSDILPGTSQTNSSSNRKRSHTLFSLRLTQTPVRAVLEPISPKQMLPSDLMFESTPLSSDVKNSNESTTRRDARSSDKGSEQFLANLFSDSCMKAFNLLRAAFEEKLVSGLDKGI